MRDFQETFLDFLILGLFIEALLKSFVASALPRFSSRWFVYKTNDNHATQKSSTFSKPLSLSLLDELKLSLAPALRYLACFKQSTNLVCFWKMKVDFFAPDRNRTKRWPRVRGGCPGSRRTSWPTSWTPLPWVGTSGWQPFDPMARLGVPQALADWSWLPWPHGSLMPSSKGIART